VDRLGGHLVRDHIDVGHEDVAPFAGVELLAGGFFGEGFADAEDWLRFDFVGVATLGSTHCV